MQVRAVKTTTDQTALETKQIKLFSHLTIDSTIHIWILTFNKINFAFSPNG